MSWCTGAHPVRRQIRYQLSTTDYELSELLVYDLDLFVQHLAGETIDRHVYPVVLFPFDHEIALEALGIRLIVTRLGYHVD